MENQLVRLRDSHYFFTPYDTESQKVTIKLASSSVESFTKLSPSSARGSTLLFGPYKDIKKFSVLKTTIFHYQYNIDFVYKYCFYRLGVSFGGALHQQLPLCKV